MRATRSARARSFLRASACLRAAWLRDYVPACLFIARYVPCVYDSVRPPHLHVPIPLFARYSPPLPLRTPTLSLYTLRSLSALSVPSSIPSHILSFLFLPPLCFTPFCFFEANYPDSVSEIRRLIDCFTPPRTAAKARSRLVKPANNRECTVVSSSIIHHRLVPYSTVQYPSVSSSISFAILHPGILRVHASRRHWQFGEPRTEDTCRCPLSRFSRENPVSPAGVISCVISRKNVPGATSRSGEDQRDKHCVRETPAPEE